MQIIKAVRLDEVESLYDNTGDYVLEYVVNQNFSVLNILHSLWGLGGYDQDDWWVEEPFRKTDLDFFEDKQVLKKEGFEIIHFTLPYFKGDWNEHSFDYTYLETRGNHSIYCYSGAFDLRYRVKMDIKINDNFIDTLVQNFPDINKSNFMSKFEDYVFETFLEDGVFYFDIDDGFTEASEAEYDDIKIYRE